jgi:hypothetical protein
MQDVQQQLTQAWPDDGSVLGMSRHVTVTSFASAGQIK